jgi:hypothetical protein
VHNPDARRSTATVVATLARRAEIDRVAVVEFERARVPANVTRSWLS